jgi:hypothetical protein
MIAKIWEQREVIKAICDLVLSISFGCLYIYAFFKVIWNPANDHYWLLAIAGLAGMIWVDSHGRTS